MAHFGARRGPLWWLRYSPPILGVVFGLMLPGNRRHIAQEKLPAAAVRPDHQSQHLLGRTEFAQWIKCNMLLTHANPTAVRGNIAILQLTIDLFFIDAKLCQALSRYLKKHRLLLLGEKLNALDAWDQQQLAAQKFHVSLQFRQRVTVSRHGQKNAEHIAEIIHHH
jgi:hypothetical protein